MHRSRRDFLGAAAIGVPGMVFTCAIDSEAAQGFKTEKEYLVDLHHMFNTYMLEWRSGVKVEFENRQTHWQTNLMMPSGRYSIHIQLPSPEHNNGYIGCIYISNEGGGRDLHDGPFTQETVTSIMADIVGVEMGKA